MDRQGLFQIGEVAKLFHLSVSSLRSYERLGLLTPEAVNPQTGYRYYSTRQFEALNAIRYLRLMDTPLDQIRDFLKNRDVEQMRTLLCQQKAAVREKRRALERVEGKIDRRLEQLEDALTGEVDVIRLTAVPPRRAALVRERVAPSAYFDLENVIRRLDWDQSTPLVFLGKVGVGISREHLLAGEYGSYDMVFLLLDPEDEYTGAVTEYPAGDAVTLRFRGSHREAPAQYERLAAFLRERRLEPTGHSWEVTLIDNGFTEDSEKFVTEIQIPVKPL